mmetsp:Transcript_47952/g.114147  ORF Transcript_47952/g.114147 Transcript_47952/m.114147 type:complete len:216 (-) Transcript_47952:2398-3045(-)
MVLSAERPQYKSPPAKMLGMAKIGAVFVLPCSIVDMAPFHDSASSTARRRSFSFSWRRSSSSRMRVVSARISASVFTLIAATPCGPWEWDTGTGAPGLGACGSWACAVACAFSRSSCATRRCRVEMVEDASTVPRSVSCALHSSSARRSAIIDASALIGTCVTPPRWTMPGSCHGTGNEASKASSCACRRATRLFNCSFSAWCPESTCLTSCVSA